MKKNFLVTMLAAICLAACAETKTEIKVIGELGEPLPIKLCAFRSPNVIAEGQNADGIITFVVDTAENVFATICREGDRPVGVCTVILDGSPIEITLDGNEAKVTKGSDQNMRLNESSQRMVIAASPMDDLMKEYGEAHQKYNGEIPDSLMEVFDNRYDAIQEDMNATMKQIILENSDNLVPIFYLLQTADNLGVEFIDSFLQTYKFKDNAMLDPVRTKLGGARNKVPGAPVVDFVGKDLNGKECHLTDYVGKGKYVLVDFWASWCGPCRAEMPNVKANYEKYKDKGFEIVGISFDSDKEAWAKGVEALGITWPQISDLKGWQCAASDLYDIKSIPATILYGPDGKVIKTDLRGEELGKTLAEYLGE